MMYLANYFELQIDPLREQIWKHMETYTWYMNTCDGIFKREGRIVQKSVSL